MVRIPYIKIPSVRVGSIVPTSNIGTGGATPAPPTPITYLTQWKIVGNSEVHTLPYPDGVVLPNGYKRCEYLTFDGSSYIDTGVKTANDIGYDLRFKSVPNVVLIGGRSSASEDGFVVGNFYTEKIVYVSYGGITAYVASTVSYNDGNIHRIILDSVKFQIDNEVVNISSLRKTADNFLDIYLGTWNHNGTPDKRMWTSDIYDTIIYNTQGELWHGIPCLDDNDVPCFYDIVSQTAFYNQGSGSFTYKLYPQPTEIWSCGEYNATDGKYHILVQPQGGSIADIALTEPLRKVSDVADTIEFPSGTEGRAMVTRNVESKIVSAYTNKDGSQLTTTLPDNTILHIRQIVSNGDFAEGSSGWTSSPNARRTLDYTNGKCSIEIIDNSQQSSLYLNGTFTTDNIRNKIVINNHYYWRYNAIANRNMTLTADFSNKANTGTQVLADINSVVSNVVSPVSVNEFYLGHSRIPNEYQVGDIIIVDNVMSFDLDVMFADCPSLKPTTASDFEALFTNLSYIDYNSDAQEVIVNDGKLYKEDVTGIEILVPLTTPTTELVNAPQIEEADSYSCVISQGAKAVSWSSFSTE